MALMTVLYVLLGASQQVSEPAQAPLWERLASLAVLAAIAAGLIGGAVTLYNGIKQRTADRESTENMWWIEFRRNQLNNLYGPLQIERERSKRLRGKLPETEPDEKTRWRLVHHIQETKADPETKRIVERILAAGDDISKMISSHAALIEQVPRPQAFDASIFHHEFLRLSWESGKDQDPEKSSPFPGGRSSVISGNPCAGDERTPDTDLDCAIHEGLMIVQEDLRNRLRMES